MIIDEGWIPCRTRGGICWKFWRKFQVIFHLSFSNEQSVVRSTNFMLENLHSQVFVNCRTNGKRLGHKCLKIIAYEVQICFHPMAFTRYKVNIHIFYANLHSVTIWKVCRSQFVQKFRNNWGVLMRNVTIAIEKVMEFSKNGALKWVNSCATILWHEMTQFLLLVALVHSIPSKKSKEGKDKFWYYSKGPIFDLCTNLFFKFDWTTYVASKFEPNE